MSALTVYDMVGDSLDIDDILVNHDPLRTLVLSGVSGGPYTVGETIDFGTCGATGEVVTWTGGTNTMTYYLTSVLKPEIEGRNYVQLPIVGEDVDGQTSGASGTLVSDTPNYDTIINDGRVFLFAKNALGTPVDVIAMAANNCSQGFLHSSLVTVPGSFFGPIGPFDRQHFNNQTTGILQVAYSGTTDPANLGVAAVRVFRGQ